MNTSDKLAEALREALDYLAAFFEEGSEHRVIVQGDTALAEYDAQRESVESDPAAILVHAYAAGEASGSSVDWATVDEAYAAARLQLGPERCAEIEALYAEGED